MRYRQTIALLALVGFFVALYLWFYKIGIIGGLQCGSGSCEYVQTSVYGRLLGIPVAFYGVIGYAGILGVAVVGLQPRWLDRAGPTKLVAAMAGVGVLFTLYLTYVELFVLQAICRWCVASAVIIAAIFIVTLADLSNRRQDSSASY
jgi:uncharacterized membrane protein